MKQAFAPPPLEKRPPCVGCDECGKTPDRENELFVHYSNQHGGRWLCNRCFFRLRPDWPKPVARQEEPVVYRGDVDLDKVYKISETRLKKLLDVAEKRDKQKKPFASSKYWTDNPHFLGLLGESLIGFFLKKNVDTSLRVEGDQGRDFVLDHPDLLPELQGKIANVKASTYWSDPHLKLSPHEKFAEVYFLCAVDVKGKRIRYVGWVTHEQFKRRGHLHDYGHGKRLVLEPQKLNREIFNERQ